jgi:phosphoribosylanthranilate isomerase
MVWVKVCGVGTTEDVKVAERAGADAVGLMLARSPRQITPERARSLVAGTACETIIVTVDARPAEILDLVMFVACSGVQLHGAHAAEAGAAARKAGLAVYRPVSVADDVDLSIGPDDEIPLLDTAGETHGGTGKTFDWALTEGVERDFVLAGGLGPDNVAEAIRLTQPWGVDASSRLESSPGVKDHTLITRYVQEAKRS